MYFYCILVHLYIPKYEKLMQYKLVLTYEIQMETMFMWKFQYNSFGAFGDCNILFVGYPAGSN